MLLEQVLEGLAQAQLLLPQKFPILQKPFGDLLFYRVKTELILMSCGLPRA